MTCSKASSKASAVRGPRFVPVAAAAMALLLALLLSLQAAAGAAAGAAAARDVPSAPGIDAPELAKLGPLAVGVKTLKLVQHDQADVLAYDAAAGAAPLRDRVLYVDLWYPALAPPGAKPVDYRGSLPPAPGEAAAEFSVAGMAVRDAPSVGSGYPLVVVSHGYSNVTAAMVWLTENLASKGYVVAAIRHNDPPITDPSKSNELALRRPLDIAFVTGTLQASLGASRLIDASRTALIGASFGGYGVLTAAGVTLDPAGVPVQRVPGGLLKPYARGGALQGTFPLKSLRAVVAMSPYGNVQTFWGADGAAALTVPLLLIAGTEDHVAEYATGARAWFDLAIHAPRYLLSFKGAGHDIHMVPAPPEMRRSLWYQDWFEDPVWRERRVNEIDLHFITAFLDRYVKGDESRASYLEVAVSEGSAGVWPAADPALAYGAYSPGTGAITLWKGFQRGHATGLELLRAGAVDGKPGN
jgi:predicted dienelactone hydrolase